MSRHVKLMLSASDNKSCAIQTNNLRKMKKTLVQHNLLPKIAKVSLTMVLQALWLKRLAVLWMMLTTMSHLLAMQLTLLRKTPALRLKWVVSARNRRRMPVPQELLDQLRDIQRSLFNLQVPLALAEEVGLMAALAKPTWNS